MCEMTYGLHTPKPLKIYFYLIKFGRQGETRSGSSGFTEAIQATPEPSRSPKLM